MICPSCTGKGWIGRSKRPVKCPNCNGHGEIDNPNPKPIKFNVKEAIKAMIMAEAEAIFCFNKPCKNGLCITCELPMDDCYCNG